MAPAGIISMLIFLVISLFIIVSAVRSPISRKIGLRNVKRRVSSTVLVVLGSMVGAALISGSLVLSDSLDKTFLNLVRDQVGELDVYVMFQEKKLYDSPVIYIEQDELDKIKSSLPKDEIDGIYGAHFMQVAPQKLDGNGKPVINTYTIDLWGVDFDELDKFGEEPKNLKEPANEDGIYISDLVAERLEASKGDKIRIPIGDKFLNFTVEEVLERGEAPGDPSMVANLSSFNRQLGLPETAVSGVFISAKGGIKPDNYKGDKFEESIEDGLKDFESDNVSLTVYEVKEDALNGFGMKMFSNFFLVMSFFGIFAGILLIVNLYSMLAAERKYEMGILRAIALTRMQLTKTFIYEGYVYSVISSFFGAMIGLGIGYFLIWSLDKMFTELLDLVGMADLFKLTFDANLDSLLVAFSIGAIITILTAVFSSYKISRLNIVAAIRDLEEEKAFKVNIKWIVTTTLLGLMTMMSLLMLMSFFTIRSSFESMREQGNSSFAELSDSKFEETVNVMQSYALYVGFVFSLIFGTVLFNRLFKLILKKDIARYTISLTSIAIIVFTGLLSKFDSFIQAGQSQMSIALFFISGVSIVIAMAMAITYNMGIIISVISFLLRPFKGLNSVIKIALRYPAENRMRTGLTLVMFAIVIFLIVYTSMMKVTIRQINENTLDETLGGYQVLVMPSYELPSTKISEMKGEINEVEGIEKVTQILHTTVILPEYKYKDLDEAPVYDNPALYQFEDEDYFRTQFDALPEDYIRDRDIELDDRLDSYSSDEEVWEAVINDHSKIVIGDAFTQIGYGKRPDLKLGDKVKITSFVNTSPEATSPESETEVYEIVGVAKTQANTGMSVNFYPRIITTDTAVYESFEKNYTDQFSNSEIMVKYAEGADIKTSTKDLKKTLIDYNIMQILELKELTEAGQGFMDSMILMFQAFLGFSLIVGASGLSIIMTRSVQERKQQIGMLRSLGFQRSMVLASFFIEATFITFLGIAIGISMGTLGALNDFYVTFHDEPDIKPVFAYKEVFIIAALVYVASILFSLTPSIKAAKLSPVEATNYPE